MNIRKVTNNKKAYIDLLLLADEQESMIDKYLERGEMFVLDDNGVKAECVVTKEADGVYELKNIAVMPDCQRKGYGKSLIDFLFSHYSDCNLMLVGTGDVPSTLSFYKKCGFVESHRIKNFFIDNYDHPMFEDGKQLVDMVYLKRERGRNKRAMFLCEEAKGKQGEARGSKGTVPLLLDVNFQSKKAKEPSPCFPNNNQA